MKHRVGMGPREGPGALLQPGPAALQSLYCTGEARSVTQTQQGAAASWSLGSLGAPINCVTDRLANCSPSAPSFPHHGGQGLCCPREHECLPAFALVSGRPVARRGLRTCSVQNTKESKLNFLNADATTYTSANFNEQLDLKQEKHLYIGNHCIL